MTDSTDKNQKVIFLDLDGTIYSLMGVIPESTKEAIHRAQSIGHMVFLNTGRNRGEIPEDVLKLNFDGLITSGGASVEIKGKRIYNETIPGTVLKKVYDYLISKDIIFTVEDNLNIYGNEEQIRYQKEIYMRNGEKTLEQYKRQAGEGLYDFSCGIDIFIQGLTTVENIYKVKNINKVMFHKSKITIEEMKAEIGGFISIIGKDGAGNYSDGEMYHKDINKATGMEVILNYYGLRRSSTIAFGDNLNDLEMISYAGIGVAMGNAVDLLKSTADLITRENDKDGLYYGFEQCKLLI